MPRFTVQAGSVTVLIDPKVVDPKEKGYERVTLKVGEELELTKAQAAEMDPTGHYLCPTAKYVKGEVYTPKARVVKAEPEAVEPDEDELPVNPDAKP